MPSTASEKVPATSVLAPDDPEQGRAPNFLALIDSMAAREKVDPDFAKRLRQLRTLFLRVPEGEQPFLTVMLRTQGRRLEALKDALLCLQAQTTEDFEVIVLMHNALPDDAVEVEKIISRQPPSFRERIRTKVVEGGTRSKPLNVGIEAAHGRYVAVFDDDDLLFANWVEVFAHGAREAPSRLIRAAVGAQLFRAEQWPNGAGGYRAVSWPKPDYPERFDQFQHLLVNYSPFMSWAFPAQLFELFGVRFDEELTVCEDWDVILRGSLLCGVDDVPELTAIYRRWEDASSSYTEHSKTEWAASERRVIDRIDRSVIMMPPGTMQAAREMVLYNIALQRYRFLFRGHELRFPLNVAWRVLTPAVKFGIRVRNKVRRMRGKAPSA